MSLLAINNERDCNRLRETAKTQYEKDLAETLIYWRFRYWGIFKEIQDTAEAIQKTAGVGLYDAQSK